MVNNSFTGRRKRRRWLGRLRPFLLLAILCLLAAISQPGVIPAFGPLAVDEERVDEQFTRCGRGRGFACVVDGDTIRLGQRRIRLIGIDTPELREPKCADEARLAEEATEMLRRELNAGPVLLVADARSRTDRYGRDLRRALRLEKDGSRTSIGGELVRAGLAIPYVGMKGEWC